MVYSREILHLKVLTISNSLVINTISRKIVNLISKLFRINTRILEIVTSMEMVQIHESVARKCSLAYTIFN